MSKISGIFLFVKKVLSAFSFKTWIAASALILFLWVWIFGQQGLLLLENLRHKKSELLSQQKKFKEEETSLKKELRNLEDPDYLKHLIHKDLGYVQEDEVLIREKPQ